MIDKKRIHAHGTRCPDRTVHAAGNGFQCARKKRLRTLGFHNLTASFLFVSDPMSDDAPSYADALLTPENFHRNLQ
jgi:hypothetical protein